MTNVGQLDARSREHALSRLRAQPVDVLVIGGGVTGAGTALDAAARGLHVGLIEKDDFASGTSSQSSKMIHGGIRYLQQGRLSLVREALAERRRLLTRIAPHLVQPVPFLIPLRTLWQRLWIGAGVWLYERLGGAKHVPAARYVSHTCLAQIAPSLRQPGDIGAIQFYDAQTDDARYVLMLIRTAVAHGAAAVNGLKASALLIEDGRVCGARVCDQDTGDAFDIRARHTVSASGAWAGDLLPDAAAPMRLRPSKGVHLVLKKSALTLASGVISRTGSGLLFIIPWQGFWLIGDTDTPWHAAPDAVEPTPEDVAMLLVRLEECCAVKIRHEQIVGVFAGLRPLLAGDPDAPTVALGREHRIESPLPGWTRISGGKFTTYRVMAEQVVDVVVHGLGDTPHLASRSHDLPLLGAQGYAALWAGREQLACEQGLSVEVVEHLLRRYGDCVHDLFQLMARTPHLRRRITGTAHTVAAEIVYACTHEGARHVDDVMERRTRIAILTPNHGQAALDEVLCLMQVQLAWSDATTAHQRERYLRRSAAGQHALHPHPLVAAHHDFEEHIQ